MGKVGRILTVPMRRRREGKTDYRQRLKLLKSGQPRFVVRRSLTGIICHVVKHSPDGDRTIASVHSSQLKKYGWKINCGNLPAAYLTGLLAGMAAKKAGVKSGVLDAGLYISNPGSRIYACLKGLIDAGIVIPHSADIFPSQERLSGKHISGWAGKLKSEPEKYKRMFSGYMKAGIDPQNVEEQFLDTKKNILKG